MSNWLSKFIKGLVGITADQVWEDFASAIGADFVPRDPWRSNSNQIHWRSNGGVIILDTYLEEAGEVSLMATRARATYLSQKCFYFVINRKTLWNLFEPTSTFLQTNLGKTLSNQGFGVKTNDDGKAEKLLSHELVNTGIHTVFRNGTEIKIDFRKSEAEQSKYVHELTFTTYGVIQDAEFLQATLSLISMILEVLSIDERT